MSCGFYTKGGMELDGCIENTGQGNTLMQKEKPLGHYHRKKGKHNGCDSVEFNVCEREDYVLIASFSLGIKRQNMYRYALGLKIKSSGKTLKTCFDRT